MNAPGKSVLITGASTGIGRATALHLDHLGFRVFAGIRSDADARALQSAASGKLTPLNLDVTDPSSIASAAARVQDQGEAGSFGLVNNAGLSLNGPLELVPIPEVRRLLEVNILGLVAMTQAFIPLLRERRGRLVNISSGHGLLALPDKSAYAASKFAVQAISDSLRLELGPFGIRVSNLVVGKVDTAVLGKILAERERLVRTAAPEVLNLYSPLLEFFDREIKNLPSIPPGEVAKVVARALTAQKPRAHYLVGPGAKKMKNLARLPLGLRDRLMYKALYGARRS